MYTRVSVSVEYRNITVQISNRKSCRKVLFEWEPGYIYYENCMFKTLLKILFLTTFYVKPIIYTNIVSSTLSFPKGPINFLIDFDQYQNFDVDQRT